MKNWTGIEFPINCFKVWAIEHPVRTYMSELVSIMSYPCLPPEMNVAEYGQPSFRVHVYRPQMEELTAIFATHGAEIINWEEDDLSKFYTVWFVTNDLDGILDDIAAKQLRTQEKIRMTSKPGMRMVSKSQAYNRDSFAYQAVSLYAGKNKWKKKPTDPETVEFVHWKPETMYEGSAIRALVKEVGLEMFFGKNGKVLLQTSNGGSAWLERATNMFMTIQANVTDDEMKPVIDKILNRCYVMRSSGIRGGIAIGYEEEDEDGKVWVRFFGSKQKQNGKALEPLPIEQIEYGMQTGSVMRFEPAQQSPSMTRTKTIFMLNTTVWSREKLISVIDRISSGAFSIMLAAYADQDLATEKAMKKIGRLSLMMTGSSNMGLVENFAVFLGELTAYDSVFHDGWAWTSAEFIQKKLVERGIYLTIGECYKFTGQARICTIKGLNQVVDRWCVDNIIRDLKARKVIKGIIHVDPNMPADEKRRIAIDIEKNENHKYDGFLFVYGDINRLDYFGDLTNMKCMFDLSMPLEYCLMDIPVEPKGHALTSRQICDVMQTCPHFLPMFVKLGQDTIDHIISGDISADDFVYDEEEGCVRRLDLSHTDYADELLSQIIPGVEMLDNNLRRTKTRSRIDAANRVCNRFNFRIQGGNFKIVGDAAGLFDGRLLAEDEVYVPGYPTQDITRALAFRHPLCGLGEHLIVKFVTLEEILNRLEKLKRKDGSEMPIYAKETIRCMIKSMMPGLCMLSSTYAHVTAYFSGADFDGDMITLIWQPELLAMAETMPLYYVDFGGHSAADKTFRFGYDLIPASFRYQYGIGNGDAVNPSIGMLAGYNVTVIGMLNKVINDKTGKTAIYVRNMFRAKKEEYIWKPVKGDYKRAYAGNVSFKGREKTYAYEFEEAVATAGNTRQEVIDFLLDLNVIISKCMNDIIDAAKTGDKVHVPFLDVIQSRIRAGAVAVDDYGKIELMPGDKLVLAPLQLSIKGTQKEIKDGPHNKYWDCALGIDQETPEDPRVLIFEDTLTELRNAVLAYAHAKITEMLKINVTDAFGAYKTQDPRLENTLKHLSSQYIDVMRSGTGDKRTMKKVLAGMARNMVKLSGVSSNWLIHEMRNASRYINAQTKQEESNGFYLAFVPELAKYFVNKYCPDKVFTNRVYRFGKADADYGRELEFVNGFAEGGFYAEVPVNGTFTLDCDEDGRAMIRKPVREMLPQVEEDDRILVELNNIPGINSLPLYNENSEDPNKVLSSVVETARAKKGGSVFSFEYVDQKTGKVVNSYDNASLSLVIDGKPVTSLRMISGKSYFAKMLLHQKFEIERTEIGERGPKKSRVRVVYLIGRIIRTKSKVVKQAA